MLSIPGRLVVAAALSLILFALNLIFSPPIFSQEETEYKRFKLEDASCDVGLHYKNTPQGLTVGISAIATGKGAEFRKWNVSEIKLRIGGERIRPDKDGKFYVMEESFFRVPGAILFAAIGALGEYSNNDFENGISKVGVALGLGLIALQAKGEITGQRCVFYIPGSLAKRIEEGKDTIEVIIKNDDQHLEDTIKIGLIRPTGDITKRYNFKNMKKDKLLKRMDSLKENIISLEQEQSSYKYGTDPEYDAIQRKIENLETERGLAYKAWFEKK